jgi:hypothetical protein
MGVNYYIANPVKRTFIELDKGSWSWFVDFIEDFANPVITNDELDYLLKNSVNLKWKADDQETISWWRDKLRNYLLNQDMNDIYLIADDTWIKADMTNGLSEDLNPPFYNRDKEYTEIRH